MRFLVGVLALAVLGVLVGAPAAFMLGWSPLSADQPIQHQHPRLRSHPRPRSKPGGETAVTLEPKGASPSQLGSLHVKALYMSPSDRWRRPHSYHHGNLKEVLLEAARKLIEQYGPAGFSLTEAARLAGVSPAAPYRHFRDRDALLAEVARSGFERFAARLDLAWDNGIPTPLSAFDKLGKAYLAFARDEPASYTVMFEAGIAAASARADPGRRACLRRVAAGGRGSMPPAPRS